jgi:hypothetical protein
VDGSASNDAGNLVAEARMAMLLQRVARGADAMSAREALEIATLGGAQVLGRDDCGALEPGKRADVAIWDVGGGGGGVLGPGGGAAAVRADAGARPVCRGAAGGERGADRHAGPAAAGRSGRWELAE